jgi:hypothetical protein
MLELVSWGKEETLRDIDRVGRCRAVCSLDCPILLVHLHNTRLHHSRPEGPLQRCLATCQVTSAELTTTTPP